MDDPNAYDTMPALIANFRRIVKLQEDRLDSCERLTASSDRLIETMELYIVQLEQRLAMYEDPATFRPPTRSAPS